MNYKQHKNPSSSKNTKEPTPKRKSTFVSFHPTKEEKEQAKARQLGNQMDLSFLETWLEDGHKFIMGFNPDKGAYYAMIREGGKDWDEAVSLSSWHVNLELAVIGLQIALCDRYSSFPNVQLDFDSLINW